MPEKMRTEARNVARRAVPTARLLGLAAAAPAPASYAPKLSLKVTPSAPAQPAAFSSTVTQAASETPTRTAAVTIPPEMTLNASSTATECTAAQESARACPESSRLGHANAAAMVVGLNVPLAGTVHLGAPRASDRALHVIVFLDND